MPRLSQAAKDAAFENQNHASAVAIGAAGAAGGSALIPVAGPFVAAAIGLVGAAFGWRALRQGKLVHDPPRDDYQVPTTLAPPLIERAPRSDTALDSAAAELARVNDEAIRAFDAMMLALERASGAELAGDAEIEAARTDEVFEFAALASDALRASSERVGPFRAALEEFHPDVIGALEAAGVPHDTFRYSETLSSDDPVADLDNSLGPTAESDFALSQYLATAVADRSLIEPGAG